MTIQTKTIWENKKTVRRLKQSFEPGFCSHHVKYSCILLSLLITVP